MFLTVYTTLLALSLVFVFILDRRKYDNVSETLQFFTVKIYAKFPLVKHADPVSYENPEWYQVLGYTKEQAEIPFFCDLYHVYNPTKNERKTIACVSLEINKTIEIVSIVKNICETVEIKTQQKQRVKLTREERYERNIAKTIERRQAKRTSKASKKNTSLNAQE